MNQNKDMKKGIIIGLLIALIIMGMWRNHLLYEESSNIIQNPSNQNLTGRQSQGDTVNNQKDVQNSEEEAGNFPEENANEAMKGAQNPDEREQPTAFGYTFTGEEITYENEELPYLLQIDWSGMKKEEQEEGLSFTGTAGGYMYIHGTLYYFKGELEKGGILQAPLISENDEETESSFMEIWFLSEEELVVSFGCVEEKVSTEGSYVYTRMDF